MSGGGGGGGEAHPRAKKRRFRQVVEIEPDGISRCGLRQRVY